MLPYPSYVSAPIAGRWEFRSGVYLWSRHLRSGLMSRRRNREPSALYTAIVGRHDRSPDDSPVLHTVAVTLRRCGIQGRMLASEDLRQSKHVIR